ncbi:MAG: hypothetical protein R2857_00250 [Vampirovibrionales bacterium]
MRGVTAITNPLVNSYKRLVPGYEARCIRPGRRPTAAPCCVYRPSAASRPVSSFRSPDPPTNPYLAFATLLQAGIDGIENKIEPPKPAEVNIYNLSEEERAARKIEPLPGSLYEALAELKTSPIAKKALGDHIYNEFIATKEREWKSFSVNVSPWELETYMRMH